MNPQILPSSCTVATTVTWQEWLPPLNDQLSLVSVHHTLPGLAPEDINFWVKLFENPSSRFALPGAIDLFGHDCIHVLLSRGLLNQDEAFVIGYSMGNAKAYRSVHGLVWKWVARYFYPSNYRISRAECHAFDLGVALGQQNPVKNIHLYDFSNNKDKSIKQVREELGIDIELLKKFLQKEVQLISPQQSVASKRLVHLLSA